MKTKENSMQLKLKSAKASFLSFMGMLSAGVVTLLTSPTTLADSTNQAILDGANSSGITDSIGLEASVANVVNVLLFVIGIIAVVVIIVGGIMFVTSAGDPGRAKKAKDAILYAVVGLAVAILSYAIVTFVIGAL